MRRADPLGTAGPGLQPSLRADSSELRDEFARACAGRKGVHKFRVAGKQGFQRSMPFSNRPHGTVQTLC